MFADPEIPVRVPGPNDVDLILEVKTWRDIGPPEQLVENDAVIDALDPHFAPLPIVKQPPAAFSNLR